MFPKTLLEMDWQQIRQTVGRWIAPNTPSPMGKSGLANHGNNHDTHAGLNHGHASKSSANQTGNANLNRMMNPGPLVFDSSARQTHRLLHVLMRERSRIDRFGGEMSLIVFTAPATILPASRQMRRLLDMLKHRLRITDEIGQIDRQRVFALLPNTDADGAQALSRQIQHYLTQEKLTFQFAVFRYKSETGQYPTPNIERVNGGSGRSMRESDRNARSSQQEPRDPNQDGDTENHESANHDASKPASSAPQSRRQNTRKRVPTPSAESQSTTHAASGSAFDSQTHQGASTNRDECLATHFPHRMPWWKRSVDVVVASVALILALPILTLVAIAIRLESSGPVLFKQWRTGVGGKPFRILKFRTMVNDAERLRDRLLAQNEHAGPAFKIRRDPRITRIGKFLRASSIDELPQLINVLRGDMTLVGPRPLPIMEARGCNHWQHERHSVHPGLTCIWQVSGRSQVNFDDWARMDLRYIRKRSFWRDLKILLATIPAVLKRDGAY